MTAPLTHGMWGLLLLIEGAGAKGHGAAPRSLQTVGLVRRGLIQSRGSCRVYPSHLVYVATPEGRDFITAEIERRSATR